MAIKAADQITITDITDAYSVILTSEAFTFVGGTGGAASGSTCSTDAVAYCGTNQCSNVSVTQSAIKFYNTSGSEVSTGISATVTNSGTSKVTIEFTLSATLSNALEADIPVVVDGITVHKKFSLAVAKTGAQGQQGNAGVSITGVVSKYKLNNSTTAPTIDNTWSETPSAPTTSNKYLWAYETISYSSGNPTTTPAHIVGTYGETGSQGIAGSKWYTGTAITGTSTTPTAFSGSGITNAAVNDQYLNTSTGNTYICTTGGNASTALWKYTGNIKGVQGDSGADAITISVTSSNGTVFKNNSGSTVLTAHVYKAGAEKTVNASTGVVADSLGTIKWYKGAPKDTQPSGWPKSAGTLAISASDVSNVQPYTCQLES